MRKFLMFVSILLIALGLLGCSIFYSILPTPTPDIFPTQSAQRMPKLTGDWHIRMEQTGGIAGVSRTLEISSSGEMTVIDEHSKKQNTSQLPPDKFAMLKEVVASTVYRPISQPMGCADCFIFNLQIDNGKERFQVQIDEVNLPNSGLESLVGFLGKLLNSNN
jgi:hypothetical protein